MRNSSEVDEMARVLRSVNNALAVLESFSVERPEIGVTELSHTLGLGKSTVHRLLTSLASRGYVRKNPETERYCLGFKAFEVGALAAGRGSIRDIAAPFLRSLMLASKETVHLGVLDEWEVVYIDKIESDQPLQMYSRVGRRAPLHCTALGKSLAAWEPEDWIERFLRRRLRAYTPSTLTEPGDVRRELTKIRATATRWTARNSPSASSASPRRCSITRAGSWPRSASPVRPCGCRATGCRGCPRWSGSRRPGRLAPSEASWRADRGRGLRRPEPRHPLQGGDEDGEVLAAVSAGDSGRTDLLGQTRQGQRDAQALAFLQHQLEVFQEQLELQIGRASCRERV